MSESRSPRKRYDSGGAAGRRTLLGLAAATCLALAGCSSTSGHGVNGEISLGPGGRAVGTVPVPPRVETTIALDNPGAGLAEFRIGTAAGELLQGGALGTAETRYLSEVADEMLVFVIASGDTPIVFDFAVRSAVGAVIEWDLQHAASDAAR